MLMFDANYIKSLSNSPSFLPPALPLFLPFFFFFCLFRATSTLMEVLRLGAESEMHLLACTSATATWNLNRIYEYTTVYGNSRSLTHRARPKTEPMSSCIQGRFATTEPQQELCNYFFNKDT